MKVYSPKVESRKSERPVLPPWLLGKANRGYYLQGTFRRTGFLEWDILETVNLLKTSVLMQITPQVTLSTLLFSLANSSLPEHGSLQPSSFPTSRNSITHEIRSVCVHPWRTLRLSGGIALPREWPAANSLTEMGRRMGTSCRLLGKREFRGGRCVRGCILRSDF